MAIESEQIEAVESKTLIFLKELMKKNPTQNYHGAAVIAMSAQDIDAEMRNPNSQIRKDFLAAIEIQDFIAFLNNVLLPEITRKAIEARDMLEDEGIYITLKQGQPPSIDDSEGIQLPNQDAEKIKPLRGLLDDVKKLESLTSKLQQLEVNWRVEKINFVKEKLEGALKKVEERISTMPDEDPGKKELIKVAQELTQDIVDLGLLKNELLDTTEINIDLKSIKSLLNRGDDKITAVTEKISKLDIPGISILHNDIHDGLEKIDRKNMLEYKKITDDISSLKSSISSSIDKFESSFGKDLGLGDMMQKFDSNQHHTISTLKDTLNLDLQEKKAHDLNHFKK